jgi:SAM-dependent MidA family methyltransferase
VSEVVADRVREAIADRGPIGFDEFMELALYGPGGFFEAPPVGADRHFVTSPHVHPFVFSHCLRAALLDAWHALGEPNPLTVVELGAGDGTLAAALLEAFAELPTPRVDYTAVEISPGARGALGGRGLRAVPAIEELEPFEGVAFANELLDNLPFLRARGSRSGVVEIRVGLEGDDLVEVEAHWERPDVPRPSLDPGQETIVPIGSFAMLEALAARIRRGHVIVVDYDSDDRASGSVRGYRAHRDASDVLARPGDTDITAGVDFGSVAAHAERHGLRAFEPVAQAAALESLGHRRWERTMKETQSKLQDAGRGADAVRVWQARSRASLLAEPGGLGGLRWLVLTTEGLPEPDWLERAHGPRVD